MHGAVASQALGRTTVDAVLEDVTSAPIPASTRATLILLAKLTLSPEQVDAADIRGVRAAGASDRAILEAIYVCFLFNLIDRVADALDFEVPTPRDCDRSARILLRFGYRI